MADAGFNFKEFHTILKPKDCLAFLASFHTRINFSITIGSIYTGFK